jgi:hypothetical protein
MGANNAQGSKTDREVEESFRRTRVPNGVDRAECKHCKDWKKTGRPYQRSWNTTYLRIHLAECTEYQDYLKSKNKDTPSSALKAVKAQILEDKQSTLSFKGKFGTLDIKRLNRLFGMAV